LSKNSAAISYGQSLLWIALFMAIASVVLVLVEFVFFELRYGSPGPTFNDLVPALAVFLPVAAIFAVIAVLQILTLPQLFQASAISLLKRSFGDRARYAVLLLLPLTAAITWWCYDYLIPPNLNPSTTLGPDWLPPSKGILISHYQAAFLFQALVTSFSFLYFELEFRGWSRKPLLLIALAIVVAIGAGWGYHDVRVQIEMSKNSPAS
jgi:hypothetical protein